MNQDPARKTQHWRMAPGEDAQLTPDGPTAAAIRSRGVLPFRVCTAAGGVHHRPPFPGSTVVLGEREFEVVDEDEQDDGSIVYLLEPWPADSIVRERVRYTRELVRSAMDERRRLQERDRASSWSWLLSPLVGLLPEPEQERVCDRYGLSARRATAISGLLEILAGIVFWRAHLGPAFFLLMPLWGAWSFTAFGRLGCALAFGEVSGSLPVVAAWAMRRRWRRTARADATLLPITREAFWARLQVPDRISREDDSTYLVRGLLAHLSWDPRHNLRSGEDWWTVSVLPPVMERGRLVHQYRLALVSPVEPGRQPTPPGPDAYQAEVLAKVQRQWDDLRGVGAWLTSLLPSAVQQRAVGRVGGPAVLRSASQLTAGVELLAAAWMAVGGGPLNLLSALVLAGEGGWRLRQVQRGEYAPTMLGHLIADILVPEREQYHAHRDAERDALQGARP